MCIKLRFFFHVQSAGLVLCLIVAGIKGCITASAANYRGEKKKLIVCTNLVSVLRS